MPRGYDYSLYKAGCLLRVCTATARRFCHRSTLSSAELQFHSYFLSFSPTLFAFWLRSSVVSVLFSLISETSLRRYLRLFLFLETVGSSSGLAYLSWHSVARIALQRADANTPFSSSVWHLCWTLKKNRDVLLYSTKSFVPASLLQGQRLGCIACDYDIMCIYLRYNGTLPVAGKRVAACHGLCE